jgi:hypothetical protein
MGIMTIMASTMSTMIVNQQRSANQLADRLAALDLERQLISTFADGQVCTYLLTSGAGTPIDPMNLGATQFPLITNVPSRGVANAPTVVDTNGSPISEMSPRMKANVIRMKDLACAEPPCAPASDQFKANLVVEFDNALAGFPIRPVTIPVMLKTAGPPGDKKVSTCATSVSATVDRVVVDSAAMSCGGSPSHTNCPGVPPNVLAACPAGYEITGCQYLLDQWTPTPNDNQGTWESDYHSNAPDYAKVVGNACEVHAGGAPGCGVCFRAEAICIRIR